MSLYLETSRLILRPFAEEDAPGSVRLCQPSGGGAARRLEAP